MSKVILVQNIQTPKFGQIWALFKTLPSQIEICYNFGHIYEIGLIFFLKSINFDPIKRFMTLFLFHLIYFFQKISIYFKRVLKGPKINKSVHNFLKRANFHKNSNKKIYKTMRWNKSKVKKRLISLKIHKNHL